MKIEKVAQRLYTLWGEIQDLQSAEELLEWDQETHMPSRAQEGRGKILATIAGLKHQRLVASELQEALTECEELAEDGSVVAAQVRCARFDVDRSARVPEDLVRALAEAKSVGMSAWHEARSVADFKRFEKPFAELLRLRREEASAIRPESPVYDVMLDGYEPGMTEAALVPLFTDLCAELAPRVRAVVESGVEIDESSALGSFEIDAQYRLGRMTAEAIGFDFECGRLDASGHPFCVGIAQGDVRMTWRWEEGDFRPGLFGILHESGHGLYEQGLPKEWRRTPIGQAVSLGIHESQSRLWENHVGRSRGFWRWALPHFHAAFPNRTDVTIDRLWPALHTVKPSLIRTEADEATYNLHVAIRFEIERRLASGALEVEELPQAWDDLYEEYLGIRAPDAADGVLQDIHWSQGMFGYFPTYTLGTMISAQLFAAAEKALGPLEEAFAQGEFAPLLGWLRQQIHQHGGFYTADQLVERATGEPLSAKYLLDYLKCNSEEAYGSITSP